MPEKMRTVSELSRMARAPSGRQAPVGQQERRKALQVGGAELQGLLHRRLEPALDLTQRLLAAHLAQLRGQEDVDALVAVPGARVGGGKLLPALGLDAAFLVQLPARRLLRRLAGVDHAGRNLDQAALWHRPGGADQPDHLLVVDGDDHGGGWMLHDLPSSLVDPNRDKPALEDFCRHRASIAGRPPGGRLTTPSPPGVRTFPQGVASSSLRGAAVAAWPRRGSPNLSSTVARRE